MASPDVLATALVDLEEGYSELFTEWSPALEKVIMRGNKETLESYRKEFVVVTGGPGSVTNVVGGSEIISGGRNQTGQRGNEIAPRLIYAFDVPGKDIDEANGEQDLAKLIAKYPDLAIMDFHERIATQFVMGNGTDVGGFLTLNGDTTYAPDGSARTGMFEFAAASAQNDTVHGLVKNTVPGWYHQYEDITSFASNGRYRLRKAYWAASRQAHKIAGNVDLLLADETSYNNYVQDLDDPVRFVSAGQNQKGDPAKPNIKQGIAFLDSTMYLEEKIAPASFTTAAAQDGVIYGLHSATWHAFTVGRGGQTQNKGFFSTRGPFRVPNQDMWRYEIVLSMGMWCDNLRANFVVTGGATP